MGLVRAAPSTASVRRGRGGQGEAAALQSQAATALRRDRPRRTPIRYVSTRTASVVLQDAVDQAVLDGLLGLEEAVALHVRAHALLGLTRVLGVDLVDALARLDDLARVDLDV